MCSTPFNCENTFESKNIELVNSKEKDDANPSDSLHMEVIIVVGRARLILYMRGEPYRKRLYHILPQLFLCNLFQGRGDFNLFNSFFHCITTALSQLYRKKLKREAFTAK